MLPAYDELRMLCDKYKCIYRDRAKDEIDLLEEISSETSVYPDIIIHKRGTNHYNLLAIEIKKINNGNSDFKKDIDKLKAYIQQELKYSYGLFLGIATGDNYETKKDLIKWFKNGKEWAV